MHPIIYDVAVSIDGYIDSAGSDVSAFPSDGPVVEEYFSRLETYSCAIMGRTTYEFGYRYGMRPGDNPYPHMETLVFSSTLELPPESNVRIVRNSARECVERLRDDQPGPIYLCGGGHFAGALMDLGLIDIIRLKRAPIILNPGTPVLVSSKVSAAWACQETRLYDGGYVYQEFSIR